MTHCLGNDQHFKLSILGDGSTALVPKTLNNARIRAILEETVEAKMLKMHNKIPLSSMRTDLHKAMQRISIQQ